MICQNSEREMQVVFKNLPIWIHISVGSKNGLSYIQVDTIDQTLGYYEEEEAFLLHWTDTVKIGDQISAEIQSFYFSAEFLDRENVIFAKTNIQIWNNLIWGYHIFNDLSNYIGHQEIEKELIVAPEFICSQYKEVLLPSFNN